MITRKVLARRTFLRGMGTAIALPFMDAMAPALASSRICWVSLRKVANLASRPNMGPRGRPVSFPSTISISLPCSSSAPRSAWTWRVKMRSPPDTMATRAPCARIVLIKVVAPETTRIRAFASSSHRAGAPRSMAMRSRNDASKSSSPFMVRRVIAAT